MKIIKLKELLSYLKTLWGLLGAAAVLFPGASALLKIPVATEESRIAALYPIIGTTISAFGILLLITYRERLLDLKFARKLGIVSMAVALSCFFAFLSVRVVYLDVETHRLVSSDLEKNIEVWVSKNKGLLLEEHRELGGQTSERDRRTLYQSLRGDPLDILALLMFTGTFASLGFAFTALGIHNYEVSRKAT